MTIGHFEAGQPSGLAWQWRSERDLEGFLYGDLRASEGRGFTGDDILYVYPDFVTGLRGKFRNGEALEVTLFDGSKRKTWPRTWVELEQMLTGVGVVEEGVVEESVVEESVVEEGVGEESVVEEGVRGLVGPWL